MLLEGASGSIVARGQRGIIVVRQRGYTVSRPRERDERREASHGSSRHDGRHNRRGQRGFNTSWLTIGQQSHVVIVVIQV